MTEPVVFLNDRFLPASQAKLNIYDLGIVLGASLTEMTRTFRHRPFRPKDHMARLEQVFEKSSTTSEGNYRAYLSKAIPDNDSSNPGSHRGTSRC